MGIEKSKTLKESMVVKRAETPKNGVSLIVFGLPIALSPCTITLTF
jgi:hypothetical protein